MCILLDYYTNHTNVGDIMNRILFEKLFAISIKQSNYAHSDVVAIGSTLDMYFCGTLGQEQRWHIALEDEVERDKPVHVWGTGTIYPYGTLTPYRPMIIHALRGERTKAFIERSTGQRINCPLGDPGLLAPMLIEGMPKKTAPLGIIPHYSEKDEPVYKHIRDAYPGSIIIDVQGDPSEVMRTIARCACVLSSSLHGLIIADSFGIPNRWCYLTERVLGGGHKFFDYYSAFGLTPKCSDLRTECLPAIDEVVDSYCVPYERVLEKQEQLIACFPRFDRQ
jgi:hypothetical protein